MTMFRITLISAATIALSACGAIKHYESAEQPLMQPLVAGVGDVVLRVSRQRDLANVSGHADIWGRKTDEGNTTVRYAGVDPDGAAILVRQDLDIHTNETTVTRMGAVPMPTSSTTRSSGLVGQYNYAGTSTTTGTAWIPAPQATTTGSTSAPLMIRVTPGTGASVPVGKYAIRVDAATSSRLDYSVSEIN